MNPETHSPILIFDFGNKHRHPQRQVFNNPIKIFSVNLVDEVYPTLRKIQGMVSQGYYAAGYISYEAAPAFDPAFKVCSNPKIPLMWFGIYAKPDTSTDLPGDENYTISSWESDTTREEYSDNIQKIKHAIAQGETYQVNYTMRLRTHFEGDDLGYYNRLRNAQRTDYSAYLNIGQFRILSVSPELFFKIDGNTVLTRPMKGTMPRGRWLEEDQEFVSRLAASQKDQAENVMIVDLLRNDLSKIPCVASVLVPRLFEIESYPTVHQMTSTVMASVRENTTFVDVLQSLFPCGSITGAPKISTMHLISELEKKPREIYCGTIGIIEPNGNAIFNVAIRSILIDVKTGLAEYGIGGGVTWDSTTDGEYTEAFTKAALLGVSEKPFELLETLRLDHGDYTLFDRHLTRLASSARFFNIPIDLNVITERLREHSSQYNGVNRRVRLLVSRAGEVRVESTALNNLSSEVLSVELAKTPISNRDPFLYHKTTRRDVYMHHKNEHPSVFDVLLWNVENQITEFTNGNIVLEIDGRKVTPSRNCGLLAGTFRAQLLDEGIIQEAILTQTDIGRATNIWFINSVRGWVSVRFVDQTSNSTLTNLPTRGRM